MNRFKYDAMVNEFPFIEELVAGDVVDCVHIKIARADENLLNMTPRVDSSIGSLVGIEDRQDIHFVTVNGITPRAVEQDDDLYSNYAHDDGHHYPGETILEGIHRHEVADVLEYVVVVHSGYEVENHHSTRAWNMTICKTPKGTTFAAEIAKAETKALAEVQAEAAF